MSIFLTDLSDAGQLLPVSGCLAVFARPCSLSALGGTPSHPLCPAFAIMRLAANLWRSLGTMRNDPPAGASLAGKTSTPESGPQRRPRAEELTTKWESADDEWDSLAGLPTSAVDCFRPVSLCPPSSGSRGRPKRSVRGLGSNVPCSFESPSWPSTLLSAKDLYQPEWPGDEEIATSLSSGCVADGDSRFEKSSRDPASMSDEHGVDEFGGPNGSRYQLMFGSKPLDSRPGRSGRYGFHHSNHPLPRASSRHESRKSATSTSPKT